MGTPFAKEMMPDMRHPTYRPIVMRAVEALRVANVLDVVFTVHPSKGDLLEFLGNGKQFGMTFSYCIHPSPRSLAASIDEAYHLIRDRTVCFVMPDTVVQPDDFMVSLLKSHHGNRAGATLACFQTQTPWKFGMVTMDGHVVRAIDDKPFQSETPWMWGAMVWDCPCTEAIHAFVGPPSSSQEEREPPLTDAFTALVRQGLVRSHCFPEGRYIDLGTFPAYQAWGRES